jgi:PP-loop superfamily ATP-utilizing enzyme
MERVLDAECAREISRELKSLGFRYITVDIEGYRPSGTA